MAKLSACIITYNEEKNIDRCLRSLDFADEIIVVDSGSTDRTVEIAKTFTPHVFFHEWPGFGPQKNYAFSLATGDWILSIDADEEISPGLKQEILAVLSMKEPCIMYRFPRKNLIGAYWIKYGSCFHNYPEYVARLFKRGTAHCCDSLVHESIDFSGRSVDLINPLNHYCFADMKEYRRSMDYYSRLRALQLMAKGRAGIIGRSALAPIHIISTFINYYLYKMGIRMGLLGLRLAFEQTRYVAYRYGYAFWWTITGKTVEQLRPTILMEKRT